MSLSDDQRNFVRTHAGGTITFHADHIRSRKHHGTDDFANLCFACYQCNAYKGSNVSGYDPQTDNLTPLYHPREQVWDVHFELATDSSILGRTPEGRTTVDVLKINDEKRVQRRQTLRELGLYPREAPDSQD